ncbi:hypothetical protein BU17DRAFT_47737, partial [Hysterangium stoloniferum]
FDHILAHRYLKKMPTSFRPAHIRHPPTFNSQKIVLYGLRLENLLLDRFRNMIINFGFTKQFEHRSNHLMGGHAVHHASRNLSSRGLDVGSPVDVWPCGVRQ